MAGARVARAARHTARHRARPHPGRLAADVATRLEPGLDAPFVIIDPGKAHVPELSRSLQSGQRDSARTIHHDRLVMPSGSFRYAPEKVHAAKRNIIRTRDVGLPISLFRQHVNQSEIGSFFSHSDELLGSQLPHNRPVLSNLRKRMYLYRSATLALSFSTVDRNPQRNFFASGNLRIFDRHGCENPGDFL